jgi:hypothetical protein
MHGLELDRGTGSVCSMTLKDLGSLFALVCGVLLVLMAA